MNENYPEFPDQYNSQGKLVLPAYHDSIAPLDQDAQTAYVSSGQEPYAPYNPPIYPEQQFMGHYYEPPVNPSSGYARRKRVDSAHLILIIAIIVVMIATGSLAVAAVTIFGPAAAQGNHTTVQSGGSPGGNTQAGGSASQASATAMPSPTLQPTATPMPSPTPSPAASPSPTQNANTGPLTLTITGLPNEVNNNTSIPVTVQTNQPGVQVQLAVTYAAPPNTYTSATQVTDNNGMATLTWDVQIFAFKSKTNAHVMVVGQDQNGQQVQSQQINVKVLK